MTRNTSKRNTHECNYISDHLTYECTGENIHVSNTYGETENEKDEKKHKGKHRERKMQRECDNALHCFVMRDRRNESPP